ncbi:MAG: hypothetical protein IPM29_08335 [Planctomycetes bacterium]|nr:hypothetical protein [Planctomycetota bacterium]
MIFLLVAVADPAKLAVVAAAPTRRVAPRRKPMCELDELALAAREGRERPLDVAPINSGRRSIVNIV